MSTTWLLLIYSVPAQPTRKRAAVWREIKKMGAVYLRDGVCILPEQPGVRNCDYFAESSSADVEALLERCEHALEAFLEQASEEAHTGR